MDQLEKMTKTDCCGNVPFEGMTESYKAILKYIIAINFIMFVIEMMSGYFAESMALKADALDFLGDTFTYALSFVVIGRSIQTRAKASLFKGISLAFMAVGVLGFTVYRTIVGSAPDPLTIGLIGVLAFCANMASVMLLRRYKDGDSNVRSVWLCSRNDAIGNILVIFAGIAVAYTGLFWPDILVAFLIAGLFMHSAIQIIRQALKEMRECS